MGGLTLLTELTLGRWEYDVEGCGIEDGGLEEIAELKRLRFLNLS